MTEKMQDEGQSEGTGQTSTEPMALGGSGDPPPMRAGVTLMIFSLDKFYPAPLTPGRALIVGRGPQADVRIQDPKLSHEHARFTLLDEGVLVEDLGSKNGTWRAGQWVQSTTLPLGGDVMLGMVHVLVLALGMAQDPGLVGEPAFRGHLAEELERARFSRRFFAVLAVRAGEKEAADAPTGAWVTRLREHLLPIDRLCLYTPTIALIMLPERNMEEAREVATKLAQKMPAPYSARCVGGGYFPVAGSVEKIIGMALGNLNHARPGEPAMDVQEESNVDDAPIFGKQMKQALHIVKLAAPTSVPMMLLGETGTGKDVLANHIHKSSGRARNKFHAFNCAAIPENLVEAFLFGHEKGAFTSADRRQIGAFEDADGGTLFLDEIGDLSLQAQAKLLRVLQDGLVTRVGSTTPTKVDVRVIVATNCDIETMIAERRFREDLYHRLNTIVVKIPPLRERRDEIPRLAERFFREVSREPGRRAQGISDEAMALLHADPWSGNIRELKNVIQRAVILAEGDLIQPEDLMREGQPEKQGAKGGRFKEDLTRTEKQQIEDALQEAEGVQARAAEILGIPARTLSNKIKKLGIEAPQKPVRRPPRK
ncbi:sigma 54-interacting transcriptional regulator [Polyangium sorediatum]|uniref:Sigma 54-interacting transcriptional regulator n=1 Tax=Polyangium sorediatum TaxID=889274 RepID=A0ABT6NPF7_9BACT|nr:sigma 54-interacting transcriptional regulator [Polyangium sorediatum]MDI1430204.1 sigma 54-interacting transcriptional regulator [Polyangium sorediatum]